MFGELASFCGHLPHPTMHLTRTCFTILAFACSTSFVHAAKDVDLKPLLAKPGKPTADEAFSSAELSKLWSVAKGDWLVKDGALAGSFKESDHHPAVLMLGVPNHDSIIRFSFKFEGTKGFGLSYNSAAGHLFRVLVDGEGVTVMKDGEKEKPVKKGKAKAAATASKDTEKAKPAKASEIAKAAGKIAPGEWHTMLVEVQGEKVSLQIDTGLKVEGSNNELGVDKTGYRFVTAANLTLDDVKAWAVEP
jgi:hypothetical protein